MRLSLGFEQKQVQKQILAPRMIQSMEILQLPILALEARIDQELNENPLLERQEKDPDLPEEVASPEDEANTYSFTQIDENFISEFGIASPSTYPETAIRHAAPPAGHEYEKGPPTDTSYEPADRTEIGIVCQVVPPAGGVVRVDASL